MLMGHIVLRSRRSNRGIAKILRLLIAGAKPLYLRVPYLIQQSSHQFFRMTVCVFINSQYPLNATHGSVIAIWISKKKIFLTLPAPALWKLHLNIILQDFYYHSNRNDHSAGERGYQSIVFPETSSQKAHSAGLMGIGSRRCEIFFHDFKTLLCDAYIPKSTKIH